LRRSDPTGHFNHRMLLLARESRGLTQSALAERADCTQGAVSRIENGLDEPTADIVDRLARALSYPPSFFFQNARIHGLPVTFYRKRKQMSRKLLAEIEAEVAIRSIHISALLRAAEIHFEKGIPRIDADADGDQTPEDIAQTVRAWWGIARGPIPNLVELIEQMGGIIVPCAFKSKDIDAIGQRVPEIPDHPLFFTNENIPTDRLRYTLAHELGHVVMHCYPNPDADQMEREADRFAGEFLMPAKDIQPELRGISIPKLASLKPIWRVSMGALLMRAKSLGIVTPRSYRYMWMEMGRLGFRTNEPAQLALSPEKPTILEELVGLHLDTFKYSAEELSQVLNELPGEFEKKYRRGPIRLVHVGAAQLSAG
jgi:Zn-dependent peptidase ImmA (M78 family)/DNA-binding XRE family transcriptional regulator